MSLRQGLVLVAALAAAAAARPAAAQGVRVSASLSSGAVRAGGTVTLEVRVTTHGDAPDDIALPPLPGNLQVVGTQDVSEFQFSMPGGRTRTVRRQYQLVASNPGRYTIPPISVTVDGTRYRTRPLVLAVSPGAAVAPSGGEPSPSRGPGNEVVLNAWLTPDTVWVGQQVTMRAEALFSQDVRMRLGSVPQYQAPTPSGFWTYDLGGGTGVELRYLHGQLYEVQTFRRAYFPLSAGRYSIPPAELTYDVRRGFLGSPQTQELKSKPLPVLVRPLPESGQPAGFNGAVGQYRVRAWIQPDHVSAGEAATLTLEVQGDGNVKALPPPTLPTLSGAEIYPPTEDAEEDTSGAAVSGVKRFSWVIIPRREGPLSIPPVSYPYFDPMHARYDVARSGPLDLRVGPSPTSAAAARPDGIAGPERNPGGGALRWVRSPLFAMLQATPLLAFAAVLLVRRRRRPRRPSRAELRRGRTRALAGLRERAATRDPEMLHDLERLLRERLASCAGDPSLASRAQHGLAAALEAAGLEPDLAARAGALIARIDEARYRPEPASPLEAAALVKEAAALLDEAEGEGARPRRGIASPAVLLPLAVLALGGLQGRAAPAPGSVPGDRARAASPEVVFHRALADYDADSLAASAAGFDAYVRARPDDPAGWYDLGNAWFRQGQRGRAVWAWMRGLELAPRSGAARRNLAVAGVDPNVVDAALPAVPLSRDELLLLASLGWLIGGAALALFLLRRRRTLLGVGAAAGLVAVGALATLGAQAFRGDVRIVLEPVQLRAAPDLRADRRQAVAPGEAVRTDGSALGWVRVRARDGGEGWVEANALGPL